MLSYIRYTRKTKSESRSENIMWVDTKFLRGDVLLNLLSVIFYYLRSSSFCKIDMSILLNKSGLPPNLN